MDSRSNGTSLTKLRKESESMSTDISLRDASKMVFNRVHKSIELGTIDMSLRKLWRLMTSENHDPVRVWDYGPDVINVPETFRKVIRKNIADEAKADRVFTEFLNLVRTNPIREGYNRLYVHKNELRLGVLQ
jgi:hypothetical protein